MGWKIGSGVRIGLSYFDCKDVILGDNVRIGHFNVARTVSRLSIGEGTWISNLNYITGSLYVGSGWGSSLSVGQRCNIMSRHFFDVSGSISLGDGVTLAGRETQIWSHTMRMQDGHQVLVQGAVYVGNLAYIGARATILCCDLPAGCLVGTGSVVVKSFPENEYAQIIAGNPAMVKKTYPKNKPINEQ